MDDRITIDLHEGVADVPLMRADKMNALDDAMFGALVATGDKLKTQRGVRAVVLSGEGRAFCAGLDTRNFGQMASGTHRVNLETITGSNTAPARTPGGANRAQQAVLVWREIPVPVIAAVHGVAFGGGFQLSLGADLRFVAPDAQLSVMEITWGLVPDMALISQPRAAPLSRSAFTAAVAAGSAWSGLRAGSHAEVIPPRSGRR
jgi:enoyl-CoA hydratase/carnithine racemase